MEKSLERLAFELLDSNMEVQRFVYAYVEGYRGYIPKNTTKQLDELIRKAFILRKRMVSLKSERFQ